MSTLDPHSSDGFAGLHGSHGLSAEGTNDKVKTIEGSFSAKGLQLEDRAQRAPRLLMLNVCLFSKWSPHYLKFYGYLPNVLLILNV